MKKIKGEIVFEYNFFLNIGQSEEEKIDLYCSYCRGIVSMIMKFN